MQSRWEPRAGLVALAAVLTLLAFAGRAPAQVKGVSYSINPSVDFLQWDGELGLKDAALFGPRFSANFGRTVSLQGYFLRNGNVDTDLSSITLAGEGDSAAVPLFDQELQVSNYGVDLKFNLGRGEVIPFIKGGGGVLRFKPDQGDRFEQIVVKLGAGARFNLFSRVQTEMFVEDAMFRVNRRMFSAPQPGKTLQADPDEDALRHNLAIGVGVNLLLGGYDAQSETDLDRAIRTRYESGLFGASWPIEPFAGKVSFDTNAGLEDQEILGVRTGMNFGQLLGLRGYYWHGVNSDFDDTDPIYSWGGEAQFNLTSGRGILPYLVVGAGEIDFLNDYRDEAGMERADKAALILGGGVGMTLARNFRVQFAARDYIFSETDPDRIANPDELLHNWTYTGGLTFLFGKGAAKDVEIDALGRERWDVTPSGAAAPAAEGASPAGSTAVAESPPAAAVEAPAPKTEILEVPGLASPVRTYQGDRVVTLPVPSVGEIYIRYGEPGGVNIVSENKSTEGGAPAAPPASGKAPAPEAQASEESLRRMIRDEIGASAPPSSAAVADTAPAGAMTEEERMALLEERISARVSERIERRLSDMQDETIDAMPRTQTTVITPSGSSGGGAVGGGGLALRSVYTFTGIGVDDPEQWIFGARADLGPISGGSRLRFVPEVALGAFNHGSFMVAANAEYTFSRFLSRGKISPYVFAGAGILRFGEGAGRDNTEGVLNVGYGLAKQYRSWIGFIEHQGVDLYSLHRINAGIRWNR